MVKRSRVIDVPPLYRCPYCGKRFYNFGNLFQHAKHRHNVMLLTGTQYRVLLSCKRLREEGYEWFSSSDVYRAYREMFHNVKGRRLINMIRHTLHTLVRKGILEMSRKSDVLVFRVRD